MARGWKTGFASYIINSRLRDVDVSSRSLLAHINLSGVRIRACMCDRAVVPLSSIALIALGADLGYAEGPQTRLARAP